jgi:hypothetical protein
VIERTGYASSTSPLCSLESDATRTWPHSPPLQQISVEEIGDAPVALGVGAAGSSHFSISISSRLWQQQPALQFDVAVRCNPAADGLGSGYQGPAASNPTGERTPHAGSPRWRILPLPEIAPCELHEQPDGWFIRPSTGQSSPIRWAYLIL